jgi:hypothetical protein
MQDYRNVFATPEGQRVYEDLMEFCHGNTSTFAGEALQTVFAEGQRTVLLRIQRALFDPIPGLDVPIPEETEPPPPEGWEEREI